MNLLIEYYNSPHLQRASENLYCLFKNFENPIFTDIHLITHLAVRPPFELGMKLGEKLHWHPMRERPTFGDVLKVANRVSPNEICVFANTDIIFDETLEHVKNLGKKDFLALTRWELRPDGTSEFMGSAVSQDAWIWKSPVKVTKDMDFPLIWGRDNKIAKVMKDSGYTVKNPSKQIITKHFHLSDHRSILKEKGDILKGPYLGVEPSDDINDEPKYIEIKDFDHNGQPILA